MTGKIISDLSASDYHGNTFDPRPAISSSGIKTILGASAAHAWANHPLSPDYEPAETSEAYERGTVIHSLFLEDDSTRIVWLDYENYRTKEAQTARDEARAIGQIPKLMKDYETTMRLVSAIEEGVSRIEAPLFVNGMPEQTILWEEEDGDVLGKARPDYLTDDHSEIHDLKTTAMLAAPERMAALIFGRGYDIQAAWYLRGLRAAGGREPVFRFVFAEIRPPYQVSCYALSPAALAIADQKIELALGIWRECLKTGVWRGYPTKVMHIEPPVWEETRVYEREYREEVEA